MISGIYKIENRINGMVYIGSSVNVEKRFREHKRDLIKGSHHCTYLQRSWNKYGSKCFTFQVLLEIVDPNKLITIEQNFIDIYKSVGRIYNSSPTAGSTLGHKHTEETKKKKALIWLGRKHTEATKEKMSAASKGRKHTEATRKKLSLARKGKKVYRFLWLITDPQGNEFEVKHLISFCKEHSLDQPCMTRVAQGKQKDHKGYQCRKLRKL